MCSSCWPLTHNLPASAFRVLGRQVCTPTPDFSKWEDGNLDFVFSEKKNARSRTAWMSPPNGNFWSCWVCEGQIHPNTASFVQRTTGERNRDQRMQQRQQPAGLMALREVQCLHRRPHQWHYYCISFAWDLLLCDRLVRILPGVMSLTTSSYKDSFWLIIYNKAAKKTKIE